jgi:energy-coupling factor transporter transmembrane protein EcfT
MSDAVKTLFLVLLAFLKFLSFSLAGAVILLGGAYGTWSYYVTDLPTHWVFSFCGPLMIVAGIGMIVTMTMIFRDDLLNAACRRAFIASWKRYKPKEIWLCNSCSALNDIDRDTCMDCQEEKSNA